VFIENAHDLSERHITAFKIGHQTLRSLSQALYMDYVQQRAFSYGATIYESLTTVVRSTVHAPEQPRILQNKVHTILALGVDGFSAALRMRNYEEQLREEAPVTSHLIRTASNLQPQLDERLVVMGAALERDIDKDTYLVEHTT
jgi:hypothetical protein